MKRLFIAAYILLAGIIYAIALHRPEPQEHWALYYGSTLPPEAFAGDDLIVFESSVHPALRPLQEKHKIVLGYLSLAEADPARSFYPVLEEKGLLLKNDPAIWKPTLIDIRRPEWSMLVLDSLIPAIVSQGFDGLMLDTVDSALHLENISPQNFAGMHKAAIGLIRDIHKRYPQLKLMLNRGFEILPELGNSIDMVLAESIYTDCQPGKPPAYVMPETYRQYVSRLTEARKATPSLKIYSLDYWPANDPKGMRAIERMQRRHGFIAYVQPIEVASAAIPQGK